MMLRSEFYTAPNDEEFVYLYLNENNPTVETKVKLNYGLSDRTRSLMGNAVICYRVPYRNLYQLFRELLYLNLDFDKVFAPVKESKDKHAVTVYRDHHNGKIEITFPRNEVLTAILNSFSYPDERKYVGTTTTKSVGTWMISNSIIERLLQRIEEASCLLDIDASDLSLFATPSKSKELKPVDSAKLKEDCTNDPSAKGKKKSQPKVTDNKQREQRELLKTKKEALRVREQDIRAKEKFLKDLEKTLDKRERELEKGLSSKEKELQKECAQRERELEATYKQRERELIVREKALLKRERELKSMIGKLTELGDSLRNVE